LYISIKSSPNESITHLWKSTCNHTNTQYDQYTSTKEVIKSFREVHGDKLENRLKCQGGSFFSSISKFSLSQVTSIWPTCQSKLPENIFNFTSTIRYINNSLPTRKNLQKWGLSSSSECSFCINPESLLHVVAGCSFYLDRFTWRHDSILNFIANNITFHQNISGPFMLICRHSLIHLQSLVMIIAWFTNFDERQLSVFSGINRWIWD
jgi:hypothetical protein